jgi:hypothetical protein
METFVNRIENERYLSVAFVSSSSFNLNTSCSAFFPLTNISEDNRNTPQCFVFDPECIKLKSYPGNPFCAQT